MPSVENMARRALLLVTFVGVVFCAYFPYVQAQSCESEADCGPCQACSGDPAECIEQDCQFSVPTCNEGQSCIDVGSADNIGVCCPAEDICTSDSDCSDCASCTKFNDQEQGRCSTRDCQLAASTCDPGDVCRDFGDSPGIGRCCPSDEAEAEAEENPSEAADSASGCSLQRFSFSPSQ